LNDVILYLFLINAFKRIVNENDTIQN